MFHMTFDTQSVVTVLASILFIVFLITKYVKSSKNYPPGPKGLPLVGYLPFLTKNPYLKLTELKKQYGDVYLVYLGYKPFVVLSSYKAIKEALSKHDELMGRPINFDRMPNLEKWPGVVMNYGHSWTQIRRFSLSALRSFGIGKSSLEPKIQDEINFLVQTLKATAGQATYVNEILRLSTANTVCAILFGERLNYEDKTFKQLMKLAKQYSDELTIEKVVQFIPDFIAKLFGIKDAKYYGTRLYDTILEVIEEKEKAHQPGKDDSFIDVWLDESNKSSADASNFNKRQLCKVVWDLFIAASDTTAATLHWCLLYMVKYPQAQTQIQKEIDEIIGRDRTPNMIDQKQMPYTEATIMEISRIASIVPLSVPRRALQEAILFNYVIPKDAIIVPNVWSIHYDPEIFSQPKEFKPERFLNENKQVVRVDELIPFGIGKRQCMGESLARMNLFLYLTTVLQNFTFKEEEGTTIDLEPKPGGILHPKLQKLRAISR